MIKMLRFILVISLVILLQQKAHAAIEPYKNFIKGSIKVGDSLLVKDEKFKNPSFTWSEITNISVQNALSLQILDEQALTQSFSCRLQLRVAYFSTPEQAEPTVIDSVSLNVNYDKTSGATYKGIDTYNFTNGYYVKVYVTGVSSPEFGNQMPPVLQLTSQINIDRTYTFKPFLFMGINGELSQGSGKMQRLSSGTPTNGKNQLALSWALVPGVQEYDIEWTYVDEDSEWWTLVDGAHAGAYHTEAEMAQLFRNNATRITTDKQSYMLSLVSNSNYVMVRMRQVTYNTEGLRIEGQWFYKLDDNATWAIWDLDWHQQNLNWQYSASYAEGGKKKEVVSYFDGTLRGRQTVTLNNENNVAVVQENVYDVFGRAAASILPAPVKDNVSNQYIHYFPSLNVNSNGTPYSFADLNSVLCQPAPNVLGTQSGASKYYSPSNGFLGGGNPAYNNYIPDAGGYPLSVTQYTADNTGKIRLQGGVGQVFQPGQTERHTTRYFYDKPTQWELDRIFGNDVGYAEHYLRNTVVDPNGQISISYLNASGKTIATALAGNTPANVSELPNKPAAQRVNLEILKPEQFKFNSSSLALTATTTYTPSVTGQVQLSYDIEKLVSRYPGGAFQPCSSCYYELTVTVTDDCKNIIYQDVTARKIGASGSNVANNDNCNYVEPVAAPIALNFNEIGEYYVSFNFALSNRVIENFTNDYIAAGEVNGTLHKRSVFVLNELAKLRFEDCFSDCNTARQKLGTQTEFANIFNQKLTELGEPAAAYANYINGVYTAIYSTLGVLEANCISVTASPCDTYKIPMMADVSPGGQYSPVDSQGNLLEPATNIVQLYFRAAFPVSASTDSLYMVTKADGSIMSVYDANFTVADLVTYWQPEWAEKFLSYHPEYCKLLFCQQHSASKSWDIALATKTASQAGYAYTNTNNWLLDTDPFFNGAGAGYKPEMAADLAQYSNRVSHLPYAIKNLFQMVDFSLYCADVTGTTNTTPQENTWDYCTVNNDCRLANREWDLYQSLYLDLKEKYYIELRKVTLCADFCPVGTPVPMLPTSLCQSRNLGSEAVFVSTNTYRSFNYAAGTQTTYYYVSGTAANPPSTAAYCTSGSAGTQFYTCVDVNWGSATNRMNNVWEISCTEPIPATCNASGSAIAEPSYGLNMFYAQDPYYRYDYTVVEGYSQNNQPQNVMCGSLYADMAYYDCYTVYTSTAAYNYNNVWVGICYTYLGGGGGGGGGGNPCPEQPEPQMASVMEDNINSQVIQPCEVNVEMASLSSSTQSVEADLNTNMIYAVSKTAPIESKTAAAKQKTFKKWFGDYVQKDYFAVKTGKGQYKVFRNVWVAEFKSQKGSKMMKLDSVRNKRKLAKSTLAAKSTAEGTSTLSAMSLQTSDANHPCPNTDFDIYYNAEYDPTYGNGVRFTVSATRANTCTNDLYVDIYSSAHAYIQSVFIPAGATWGEVFASNETPPLNGQYYACGTLCGDPDPSCDTKYANKTSRFPEPDFTLPSPNPNQVTDERKAAGAAAIADNCSANAEIWMERLKPGLDAGNYDANTRAVLKANLIEICKRGGDATHPFGSSSIGTGISQLYINGDSCSTFAQVIRKTLGMSSFTNELNPYLLDGTYPYSQPQQATDVYISATSLQICNKLGNLRPGGMDDAGFYNHLQNTFGANMNLSPAEFAALLKGCNNCRYLLEYDIKLPVFLQGNDGCISKTQYNTDLAALNAEFSGTPNTSWTNYQLILANYFNYKYGFTLSYDSYINFATGTKDQLCNEPAFAEARQDPYACVKSLIETGFAAGDRAYQTYINEEKRKFVSAYIDVCAAAKASVKLEAEQQIYHYTLYYYDLAGNLVRTVPPEGVSLLSATEIDQVSLNRAGLLNDNCNYNGPTTASDRNTALLSLSSALQNPGNNAVEMWLYADAPGARQFIAATPDMKYMIQACQNGNLLNVDIFTLHQAAADEVSITLSNHVTADVSSIAPLQPWTHIVVQGANLAQGQLQIWVNGKAYTPVTGAPYAGCGWAITTNPFSMPDNFGLLKFLRVYQGRLMPADEIAFNAGSKCFGVQDVANPANYRFNVPAAGGPTTIAENSNVETQFKGIFPNHGLTTTYAYNATNQVVQQQTPDAGMSKFWYDKLSRLLFSQNAKQAVNNDYSYTQYDLLGRINEVGQKKRNMVFPEPGFLAQTDISSLNLGTASEITTTYYDNQAYIYDLPYNYSQENLRKRVSVTYTKSSVNGSPENATYYSYDYAGNVKSLYQKINGLAEIKRLDYEYDQVSGKVNFLAYQKDKPDQFFYEYKYDAENRLTEAWSGVQANVVNYGFGSTLLAPGRRLDASYQYYLHGPLARMELGREAEKVQGVDYAYTLQGWLKGVNGSALAGAGGDIGADAAVIAKDALAYSLGYYTGDYTPIGGGSAFAYQFQGNNNLSAGRNLYNGNIASSTYAIAQIENSATKGYSYGYDQLNRLKTFRQHDLAAAGNWDFNSASAKFKEDFNYDGNGNILNLNRTNQNGTAMDMLSYGYNRNASGKLVDNKLANISDTEGVTNGNDLGNNSYTYDEIGNLKTDAAAGISKIDWTVYGKIKQIEKGTGNLSYTYDASGNRVRKTLNNVSTYYVRDAQGNSLAVYDNAGGANNWLEQQLYGSSRLGLWKPNINLALANGASVWNNYGNKFFELSNHLGNVMAVINDVRTPNNGYEPTVINANDYYAFGSQMPGRSFTNTGALAYRYGFNGKENDNDVKGEGNQQDYGMRIYDPRVGKFLSVDPITKEYPELTPYQFASNTPIQAIDLDGLEQRHYTIDLHDKEPRLKLVKEEDCFFFNDKVVVKVLGLPKNGHVTYTFTPWAKSIKQLAQPGSGEGNYIEDFDNYFAKDPIGSLASGQYTTNEEILKHTVRDIAIAVVLHKIMTANVQKKDNSSDKKLYLGTMRDRLFGGASNIKLKSTIEKLWRPNAKIGSGSTGDAIRAEKLGVKFSNSSDHTQKAKEGLNTMRDLLNGNHGNISDQDRSKIFEVITDLTKDTGLQWKGLNFDYLKNVPLKK
ncbi:RHS repeat domain-containing protein [Pedobacter sp.]|uniref:RHS repeat domain-containing protein n=1 Tax=Pedobacter sp. TaxID=1411316 RepID=UPI003BABF74E